jgi:hypothetical protein
LFRNYRYVNEEFLNSVLEQIPTKQPSFTNRKTLISFALNPKVDISEERSTRSFNRHEKIELFLEYLQKNNLLEYERPKFLIDGYINRESPFVLETLIATKIVFPSESIDSLKGYKDLILWVSDPNPADLDTNSIINNGTFLYIPEQWLDNEQYTGVHSGCSALQAIVNYLENRPLTSRIFHGKEYFGRNNNAHPVDKLESIGALKLSKKKITVLYSKRYITDEQCFIFNNNNTRVHDLLGYPIFIYEEY